MILVRRGWRGWNRARLCRRCERGSCGEQRSDVKGMEDDKKEGEVGGQ